jgi:N-methylhydantoinase A
MVGAFPVKVPQIDMHTVGAGGGSVAWLDVDGSLQVGPRSAGAVPGPAAYGLGGTEPTVTDANVVLGRIGANRRLGGAVTLDPARAREAVGTLAARLGGMAIETLAEGIVRIAVARMTSAIREISIQRGHDPRDFTLIAYGGAGPMHALALAGEIGLPRVLVPRHPGNFSAFGLLASDIKHDDVRTRVGPLRERAALLAGLFAEMEDAARRQLDREGFGADGQRLLRSLDLRYRGQAFELNLPVTDGAVSAGAPLAAIEDEFHRRHLGAYGHANREAAVELVNARLTAYGVVSKPAAAPYRSAARDMAEALVERRRVWLGGAAHEVPVWERERLPEQARLEGPAIVEEFGATTVVLPGWRGAVDEHGNLHLSPFGAERP